MWKDEKRVRIQSGNIHVAIRGNCRFNVFYEDQDRTEFLKHCQRASIQTNTIIEQFIIMDNHVHFHIRTKNVTTFIRSLLQGYVQWYNWKNKIHDRLFCTPFISFSKFTKEWIIDSMLYILQNPLAAGVCKEPSEYIWSSYNFHFKQKRNPLSKYISIDTEFIENYYKTKVNFDLAIKGRIVKLYEIRDLREDHYERITDYDLAKYIREATQKESIFHLTNEESTALIIKIYKETNASLRQISSLTHESYDHVRKICGHRK